MIDRLRHQTERPQAGRFQSRILSIVLSIEPGRSRHLGLAKAANRAIHLGFTVILP